MKLIIAQGNPGPRYATSRHNVGWMALDAVAQHQDVLWLEKSKFHAHIAEIRLADEKVLLVKPTTFYNESGTSARALCDFYKLTPIDDILVIHDDINLPLGTIRVRSKGSDGGNNGIKSLNTHLGPNYTRLRIGVDAERRSVVGDTDFVLSAFTPDEMSLLTRSILPRALELIRDFCRGDIVITSHDVSSS